MVTKLTYVSSSDPTAVSQLKSSEGFRSNIMVCMPHASVLSCFFVLHGEPTRVIKWGPGNEGSLYITQPEGIPPDTHETPP